MQATILAHCTSHSRVHRSRRQRHLLESLESRVLLTATWSTVDTSSNVFDGVTAMTHDAAGNVYAAGDVGYTGAPVVIRKKSSNSNNWTTIADFGNSTSPALTGMTVDTSGNIFITSRNSLHWQTWEIAGGAGSPVLIDDMAGGNAQAITVDAGNNLYVAGYQLVSSKRQSIDEWTVRKGSFNQSTGKWSFVTVDQVPSASFANGIAAVTTIVNGTPTTSIYAVGNVPDSSGNQTWVVRRSTNGGAWTQVDSFKSASADRSQAFAITGDRQGNVYVTGYDIVATITGYTKNHSPIYGYTSHWITRKSSNGGASWTVSDDYESASGHALQPYAICSDPSGAIYTAGTVEDSTGNDRALVRMLAGGSWTNADYLAGGSNGAYYAAITSDAVGNIYAGGEYFDDTQGVWNWVIRSQPAAPTNLSAAPDPSTPSTSIDLSWSNPAASDSTATAVYRSSDGGLTFTLVATLSPTTSSYTDSALSPNTSYTYYLVNLLNADGTSAPTNPVTASTLA